MCPPHTDKTPQPAVLRLLWLCLCHCAVLPLHTYNQPHIASNEVVSTWTENGRCPYISEVKTIVHPGEVGVFVCCVCVGGEQPAAAASVK
jgi:hypothetical protein